MIVCMNSIHTIIILIKDMHMDKNSINYNFVLLCVAENVGADIRSGSRNIKFVGKLSLTMNLFSEGSIIVFK